MLQAYRARTTLPALDLARAKRFYSETLGLTAVEESPGGVVFRCGAGDEEAAVPGWAGSSTFLVFPTPNPVRGGHTQMGFLVDDVRSIVTALRARGVVFEEYDLPGMRTQDGVASLLDGRGEGAWFKDTEGNMIGLVHFQR